MARRAHTRSHTVLRFTYALPSFTRARHVVHYGALAGRVCGFYMNRTLCQRAHITPRIKLDAPPKPTAPTNCMCTHPPDPCSILSAYRTTSDHRPHTTVYGFTSTRSRIVLRGRTRTGYMYGRPYICAQRQTDRWEPRLTRIHPLYSFTRIHPLYCFTRA